MNLLQKKLYSLLKDFDQICSEYGITYYLAGGSALGAVRNNGFLPWDDDVDIYITRDNWNKLKMVPESAFPFNRMLVHCDNTEYYCNPIPRFVDTESTLFYKSQVLCGKACGQHIELLIMDPLPVEKKEKLEYKRKLAIYTELLSPYFVVNRDMLKSNSYFDFDLYNRYKERVSAEGKQTILKELEEELFEYPDNCDEYCMRWGITTLVYPKRYFGQPRLEKFESGLFPVAAYAEKIFRLAYGDTWMYVPVVSEQVIHNSYSDLDSPFKRYIDDFEPLIDNKQYYFENYQNLKDDSLLIKYYSVKTLQHVSSIKSVLYSEEIKNVMKVEELHNLIKNRNYEQAWKYINSYIQKQFEKEIISLDSVIHIDEQLLNNVLNLMMIRGEYSKIIALYRLYSNNNIDNSSLSSYYHIAADLKEISRAIYDSHDIDKVKKLVTDLQDANNCYFLEKAKLWLLTQEVVDVNQIDIKYYLDLLNYYYDDGEIYKYIGDLYLKCNQTEDATRYYKKTIEKSRNGVMLLDIYAKTGLKSPVLFESELTSSENN